MTDRRTDRRTELAQHIKALACNMTHGRKQKSFNDLCLSKNINLEQCMQIGLTIIAEQTADDANNLVKQIRIRRS